MGSESIESTTGGMLLGRSGASTKVTAASKASDALAASDKRLHPGECLATSLDARSRGKRSSPRRSRSAAAVVANLAFTTALVDPYALASLSSAKGAGPGTLPKPSGGLSLWARPSAILPTLRRMLNQRDLLGDG